MYGIIPAAPPPDQSYDLTPRGASPRGNEGAGSFADQLAQLNSRSSDQPSDTGKSRIDTLSEKQRHDAEDAAKQTSSADDEAKQRAEAAAYADAGAAARATRDRAAEKADDAKSDKKPSPDQTEHGDDPEHPGVVEAKVYEQKPSGRSEMDGGDEVTVDAADHTTKAAAALTGEQEVKHNDTSQEKSISRNRKVELHSDRAKSSEVNGAQSSHADKSERGDQKFSADTAEGVTKRESAQKLPEAGEEKIRPHRRLDGASGETKQAETFTDQKAPLEDVERNRRVRAGQDPRERRLAAEKAGTQTVDAKAVSPVEAENTRTEATVTRELTIDLSESTGVQRTGGDGSENAISATRMDVALGESPSRSPSLSQATQTLARRLNGELGDNIVRQAKVMLQDANNAELRLVIRPPELGRIRIRLQMENGHIAGRILVDNGSVREVVEQNLASLQRAFEEAGLEMGDLEVSTGDARDDAEQGGQDENGSAQRTATAGAESFGRSIETISEYEPGRHRINLVA